MILLDTGLVIEAMKPEPDPAILAWLDAQQAQSLYITSITIAEVLSGIGSLPDGQGKDRLAKALERTLQVFADRIVTFDTIAAFAYADILLRSKRMGLSHAMSDIILGAIAAGHDMTLASRTPALFKGFGLEVINPGES